MIVPFLLFFSSLAGIAAALTRPGLYDLIFLIAPCAMASLFLLIRAYIQRDKPAKKRSRPRNQSGAPIRQSRKSFWRLKQKHIVVDGSNVMHWKDGTPQIETVREVVQILQGQGFTPGVVFDANAGHKLAGKYLHNRAMGVLIGLPQDQVMVVHKGSQADDYILTVARGLGVPVVTNDRYREWAETYPEVHEPGHLIRGSYLDGRLRLDMGADASGQILASP